MVPQIIFFTPMIKLSRHIYLNTYKHQHKERVTKATWNSQNKYRFTNK